MDVELASRDRTWNDVPLAEDRELRCVAARRRHELRAAFRLIYDRYSRNGLSPPNRLGLRILPHQLLQTSWVLLATRGRQLLGTFSLIEDGVMGLPIELLYPADLCRLRRQQARLAELTCFASRGDPGRQSVAVLRALLQSAIQLACRRQIEELAICVHPRHACFYERRLGFREFCPVRCCPWVCDQPAVAMKLSLGAANKASVPPVLRNFDAECRTTAVEPSHLRLADQLYFRQLLDEASPFARPVQRAVAA